MVDVLRLKAQLVPDSRYNATMTYNLFIDDERCPRQRSGQKWTIVRTVDEAIAAVNRLGVPSTISFDHDLGSAEDGTPLPSAMSFLWWLIDQHIDGSLDLSEIEKVVVHSHNPVGARNIASLWNGFCSAELGTNIQAEVIPF
jgi:hypothetical protein